MERERSQENHIRGLTEREADSVMWLHLAAKDAGKCRQQVSNLQFDTEATVLYCGMAVGISSETKGLEINNKNKSHLLPFIVHG